MRGFTLIEVILTLSLLGALALAVQPFSNVSNEGLDAAGRKVRLDVQYAQERAMLTGQNHGVNFVAATSSYQVYSGSVGTPVLDPFKRTLFDEDLSDFENVQILSNYQVEFDPNGQPVVGGGGNAVLSNGNGTRTVSITNNTGYVDIQ